MRSGIIGLHYDFVNILHRRSFSCSAALADDFAVSFFNHVRQVLRITATGSHGPQREMCEGSLISRTQETYTPTLRPSAHEST